MDEVQAEKNITLHLQSEIAATKGFKGNFTTVIASRDGERQELSHGATILATGAQEYRGPEYGYGGDPRIITQQEFEKLLAGNQETSKRATREQSPDHLIDQLPDRIVMIQCIGPAERFCSRICCTVAIKNALAYKDLNPEAEIVILYKDIRTYGFKERSYTEARRRGVIFVRYDDDQRPQVNTEDDGT